MKLSIPISEADVSALSAAVEVFRLIELRYLSPAEKLSLENRFSGLLHKARLRLTLQAPDVAALDGLLGFVSDVLSGSIPAPASLRRRLVPHQASFDRLSLFLASLRDMSAPP